MASYDSNDPQSIEEYSQSLLGHSISDYVPGEIPEYTHASSKGRPGQYLEKYFYEITPPNDAHVPDFENAGVELKLTGVKVVRKGGKRVYVAKERVSLTALNYMKIIEEAWESCSLMQKCRLMLFVCYLYDKELSGMNRRIVLPPFIWDFPPEDLAIIKFDWLKIVQKINDGKAHELSEGDTLYLGACTKGVNKVPTKPQPFSDILCKSRAFSLKKPYVDMMIAAKGFDHLAESVLSDTAEPRDFESIILDKLSKYIGMTPTEIAEQVGYRMNDTPPKHVLRLLATRMLGVKSDEVLEFKKAGISIKTIRLQINGRPKESMSFAGFKANVITQQDWEESKFHNELEMKKFLFIIFEFDASRKLRFKGGKFWNMPYEDRLEAKKVWIETRDKLVTDEIHLLPTSIHYNPVAHVRPKGRNSQDLDSTPSGKTYPKQCFWLNASYVAKILA